MAGHYIIALITIFLVFVLFLVISHTCNNLVNMLIKLEYLLKKEYDLKLEALEVRRLMEEQVSVQDNQNQDK